MDEIRQLLENLNFTIQEGKGLTKELDEFLLEHSCFDIDSSEESLPSGQSYDTSSYYNQKEFEDKLEMARAQSNKSSCDLLTDHLTSTPASVLQLQAKSSSSLVARAETTVTSPSKAPISKKASSKVCEHPKNESPLPDRSKYRFFKNVFTPCKPSTSSFNLPSRSDDVFSFPRNDSSGVKKKKKNLKPVKSNKNRSNLNISS